MIKAEVGKVSLHGNKLLLIAELETIISSMLKTNIIDYIELEILIENTKKNKNEKNEEVREILNDMSKREYKDLIEDILEAIQSGKLNDKQRKETKKFFGDDI